jgi:hypothetical protein
MYLAINRDFVFETWQQKGRNNGARRNFPLLGNDSVNTYCDNGYVSDNRGAIGGGVFCAVCPEDI